jgi:hypothetical protein
MFKMLDERLKELETAQNYSEMLNLLKKHESDLTKAYTYVRTLIENPTIIGILKALEEMSISATSLLRHSIDLLDEEIIEAPIKGDIEVSSSISAPMEITRDRDNIFSLNSLNDLAGEFPIKEISRDDVKISIKFWYIKSAQNESIELEISEKEVFGVVLQNVLKKIEADPDENFSISPLGYDALLKHQFLNSIAQLTKLYGEEFTLIKMYK